LPLYAYRCTECGHKFEKIQNFSAEQETECPECHGVLERPLTAPRLNFKGAGWYVNDYASKSSASGGESGPKSESKSDSKSDSGSAAKDAKPASTSSESKPSASTASTAPAATPSS
jgi:putative FmdB family regulatory protein